MLARIVLFWSLLNEYLVCYRQGHSDYSKSGEQSAVRGWWGGVACFALTHPLVAHMGCECGGASRAKEFESTPIWAMFPGLAN